MHGQDSGVFERGEETGESRREDSSEDVKLEEKRRFFVKEDTSFVWESRGVLERERAIEV